MGVESPAVGHGGVCMFARAGMSDGLSVLRRGVARVDRRAIRVHRHLTSLS